MTSARRTRRRLRRWDRYVAAVSRSVAPCWCDRCGEHHPGMLLPPGYFQYPPGIRQDWHRIVWHGPLSHWRHGRRAHTSGGVVLTDEVIEKLAEEAEKGYDPAKLVPRPRKENE